MLTASAFMVRETPAEKKHAFYSYDYDRRKLFPSYERLGLHNFIKVNVEIGWKIEKLYMHR